MLRSCCEFGCAPGFFNGDGEVAGVPRCPSKSHPKPGSDRWTKGPVSDHLVSCHHRGKVLDVRELRECRAWLIILLSSMCLGILPQLFWQLKPWMPSSVTEVPHEQMCGRHMEAPILKAIHTLMWLLSKRVPIRDVTKKFPDISIWKFPKISRNFHRYFSIFHLENFHFLPILHFLHCICLIMIPKSVRKHTWTNLNLFFDHKLTEGRRKCLIPWHIQRLHFLL